MNNFKSKPLALLRRLPYFLCLCVVVFTACASVNKEGAQTGEPGNDEVLAAEAGTIQFINKTPFTVHLKRGSGRVDVASLSANSSQNVPNPFASAENYYPLFDIPITDSYSLTQVKPSDINFYFRSDNNKKYQEIEIPIPQKFDNNSVYIIFTNNSRASGVYLSMNGTSGRMTDINAKSNVNVGETVVYSIGNPAELQKLRVNPANVDFGEMAYQGAYIYSFAFDGTKASLTDLRPLHRAGEAAWAKPIPDADGLMMLAAADGEIQLFAPDKNGLSRYAFDSAGNSKPAVRSGDSLEVTAAMSAGNSFFIAGFAVDGSYNKPIARIHGADGAMQKQLAPSNKTEYFSAFFNTAASKDGAWLVAGGADSGRTASSGFFPAYVRLIRDVGSSLSAEWELGRADFDAKSPAGGAMCGEVTAAAYDSARDRWLVVGKNLEFDAMKRPVVGSYIAVINGKGVIQKIDFSFKGMSFNKLLVDSSGNYYAAGEEEKGNDSCALVIKYNADGKQMWRISSADQPEVPSFYQDALLDAKDGQIVLVGMAGAKKETPLIESFDCEKGTKLWGERLTDSAFIDVSMATSIVPAPYYGYALSLAGPSGGKPYMITRVNARGKYIK